MIGFKPEGKDNAQRHKNRAAEGGFSPGQQQASDQNKRRDEVHEECKNRPPKAISAAKYIQREHADEGDVEDRKGFGE